MALTITYNNTELVSENELTNQNGPIILNTEGKYLTGNIEIIRGISNQNKTNITPIESSQTITADSGYDGLDSVQINAISSSYVGSGVDRRSSSDLSASGATITAPAGYYSTAATHTISTDTLTNTIINGAAALEDTNDYAFNVEVNIPAGYHNSQTLTKSFSSMLPAPTTEAAAAQVLAGYDLYNHNGQLISGAMTNNSAWNRTLDDNTTSITIPAGYHNGSGTVSHTTVAVPNPTISVNASGLITANGNWTKGFTTNNSYSNTQQLSTQAGTTITPSTSAQTAVAAGKYTTGAVTVAAMPSGTAGTPTATKGTVSNHSISVTPSVTNTTGYITGSTKTGTAVTVSASELVSGTLNITANNTYDVTNYASAQVAIDFVTYYTGITAPSNSQGSNGDLYLQTED